MKNEKRYAELSGKIFKMGEALIKEGEGKDDYIISSTGNFMLLISGLLFDEKDVELFSEICSMFSAKKLLESQASLGSMANFSEDELSKLINGLRDELNDDIDNGEMDNSDDDED